MQCDCRRVIFHLLRKSIGEWEHKPDEANIPPVIVSSPRFASAP
jgi:hypothetical protein